MKPPLVVNDYQSENNQGENQTEHPNQVTTGKATSIESALLQSGITSSAYTVIFGTCIATNIEAVKYK